MYSAQTMVCAQILRYISRSEYTRQSPDCPLVIFSFTALPPCLHCSTPYSSAFAQHCIVAPLALTPCCTRVHPHRLHPPRVSPSTPVSLLQVRPLPTISSESQQTPPHRNVGEVHGGTMKRKGTKRWQRQRNVGKGQGG